MAADTGVAARQILRPLSDLLNQRLWQEPSLLQMVLIDGNIWELMQRGAAKTGRLEASHPCKGQKSRGAFDFGVARYGNRVVRRSSFI